jgi:membrane protein DedA with SNARE-associated domain
MVFCEATGLIGNIVDFALNIIAHLGLVGAGAIVAVENVLPFIPSEVILPAIGFSAGEGAFGFSGVPAVVVAVLVATLASLIGALILFSVARAVGVKNVSKIPFVEEEGLEKAEDTFAKHGAVAVFFCRFIPVVRVLVTIPAGLSKMNIGKFAVFTTLGSLIWNTVFISIGAAIGTQWCSIEPLFSKYSHITVAVLIVLVVGAWLSKKHLKKKFKKDHEAAVSGSPVSESSNPFLNDSIESNTGAAGDNNSESEVSGN